MSNLAGAVKQIAVATDAETVIVELICGDAYAAQVLSDYITSRLRTDRVLSPIRQGRRGNRRGRTIMTSTPRHRWGDKVVFPHKSERDCINCGLVKVSRHEVEGGRDRYWTEYWRDEEKVESDRTPVCERVGVPA